MLLAPFVAAPNGKEQIVQQLDRLASQEGRAIDQLGEAPLAVQSCLQSYPKSAEAARRWPLARRAAESAGDRGC